MNCAVLTCFPPLFPSDPGLLAAPLVQGFVAPCPTSSQRASTSYSNGILGDPFTTALEGVCVSVTGSLNLGDWRSLLRMFYEGGGGQHVSIRAGMSGGVGV